MTTTAPLLRLRPTALAVITALSLQGCSETMAIDPASRDMADSCGASYDTITRARTTEINQQINNAVVGAVFGAMLGAAVAGDGNRGRGALAGATAGGLAGYSGTYLAQKQQRAQDATALLASINSDASAEQALVTEAGQAVVALRACRNRQVADLTDRVRSGRTQPAAARAELEVLKKRVTNDNRVVSASFNGIEQRVDAYVDASAAVADVDRAAYLAGRNAQVQAATPSVRAVSNNFVAQRNADQAVRSSIEANIQAVERLLG
ncbi:MAG: hypothetical protein ACK46Q_05405 [Hyphomonas sp.]